MPGKFGSPDRLRYERRLPARHNETIPKSASLKWPAHLRASGGSE
jgi:hypothetical protein